MQLSTLIDRPAGLLAIAAAAIVLLATLAIPSVAGSATEGQRAQLQVVAKPDPLAKPGHDPYVAFELRGAAVGHKYRITQTSGPKSTGMCSSALTTEWMPAVKGGKVPFAVEPVNTGKYYDFDGWEPCHGTYVLKVERRVSSVSNPTVRRFSLAYPSFNVRYLPIRPY